MVIDLVERLKLANLAYLSKPHQDRITLPRLVSLALPRKLFNREPRPRTQAPAWERAA